MPATAGKLRLIFRYFREKSLVIRVERQSHYGPGVCVTTHAFPASPAGSFQMRSIGIIIP
jgi:hypothetical protein